MKTKEKKSEFKFRAIRDFYIIKVVEPQTASGILIPDSAKEMALYGEVMSVGCGLIEGGVIIPLVCKVGDHVRFLPHSGTRMTVDSVEVYVLRENQVFGISG